MTLPAQPAPAPASRPSVGLLLILLCAMGAGPLFNYGVSVSSALIIERFGMTAGELGRVVTVVFASAAVMSIWLGRRADVMSARSQMLLIFGGSAVALVVAAFSSQYWLLIVAAVLAGPAQAISNPTTNRIIIRAVPAAQRTGWVGVKQSGVQASQLFAGLFFPAVALALGWTGAALGAALVCVVIWALSLKVVPSARTLASRRPADTAAGSGADPSSSPSRSASTPVTSRSTTTTEDRLPRVVYYFAAIALFSGLGMQATNVYLPLFAVEEIGFSLVLGGVAAAVSGVVGVVFRIWWGRRMQAGWRPSTLLLLICLGALLAVTAFLVAGATGTAALVWVGAALHGMTVLGANVVINVGLMSTIPAHRIGAASGINSMGMYLGFALGPLLMGWLHDLTGSFDSGWLLVTAAYLVCVGLALALRSHGRRLRSTHSTKGDA
ncbi:MFS transporter [Citricoccus muralis]|uniref:MFS transporter n=1 Tax=Citricoccus muralis TaxID=169134 RepID=A0ABY8H4N6_9MICC|nr:MFS transporter [Citricoccus muralis]WFP16102.1 MFS transporter [Citricoccus muralis]